MLSSWETRWRNACRDKTAWTRWETSGFGSSKLLWHLPPASSSLLRNEKPRSGYPKLNVGEIIIVGRWYSNKERAVLPFHGVVFVVVVFFGYPRPLNEGLFFFFFCFFIQAPVSFSLSFGFYSYPFSIVVATRRPRREPQLESPSLAAARCMGRGSENLFGRGTERE